MTLYSRPLALVTMALGEAVLAQEGEQGQSREGLSLGHRCRTAHPGGAAGTPRVIGIEGVWREGRRPPRVPGT